MTVVRMVVLPPLTREEETTQTAERLRKVMPEESPLDLAEHALLIAAAVARAKAAS